MLDEATSGGILVSNTFHDLGGSRCIIGQQSVVGVYVVVENRGKATARKIASGVGTSFLVVSG